MPLYAIIYPYAVTSPHHHTTHICVLGWFVVCGIYILCIDQVLLLRSLLFCWLTRTSHTLLAPIYSPSHDETHNWADRSSRFCLPVHWDMWLQRWTPTNTGAPARAIPYLRRSRPSHSQLIRPTATGELFAYLALTQLSYIMCIENQTYTRSNDDARLTNQTITSSEECAAALPYYIACGNQLQEAAQHVCAALMPRNSAGLMEIHQFSKMTGIILKRASAQSRKRRHI